MLSNERLGRFTASRISDLFVGGKGAVRTKYIMEKAQERATGMRTGFIGNRITEHGEFNEYEALSTFEDLTGFNVEYADQIFFKYNDDLGATPDALVKDFDGNVLAVVDAKCPVSAFFEQKMLIVNDALPEYQNVPKKYFYQLQVQMMSASMALGYPVKQSYLVRYLTSSHIDDDGNKIEFPQPVDVRMFYKKVVADQGIQVEIFNEVVKAAAERDQYIKIFNQPLL